VIQRVRRDNQPHEAASFIGEERCDFCAKPVEVPARFSGKPLHIECVGPYVRELERALALSAQSNESLRQKVSELEASRWATEATIQYPPYPPMTTSWQPLGDGALITTLPNTSTSATAATSTFWSTGGPITIRNDDALKFTYTLKLNGS